MIDYDRLKPYIYKFDPETAHTLTETGVKIAGFVPGFFKSLERELVVKDDRLRQNVAGIVFPNPVGLGAGFDKNATMIRGLGSIGFGAIEVGTVTPKPQSGNPKPRLFRYVEEETLQNAMGFNNDGAEAIAERVASVWPFRVPVGVNIGKNKITPDEKALNDYLILIEQFSDLCDYLTINISSPNTKGLRDLQNEGFIRTLFHEAKRLTQRPIFLKIAPDMSIDTALELCECAIDAGAHGIIATNTTIDYTLLKGARDFGGLSGKVLTKKSREMFQELAKSLFGRTSLISVGGIDNAQEAYTRIKMGANLIQVYSALVFKGYTLPYDINKGILELLKQDGLGHINQAVGIDLK